MSNDNYGVYPTDESGNPLQRPIRYGEWKLFPSGKIEHIPSGEKVFDSDRQLKAPVDNKSVSTDELNNRVQIEPSDDVQTRLNDAGVDSVVVFEEGTYTTSTPFTPKNGQTLVVGQSVEFQPAGDNRVWEFLSVADLDVLGTLFVNDPNANTTSATAVVFDDFANSYVERVKVNNAYIGIQLNAGTGDVLENTFGSLHVPDARQAGIQLVNSVHDNHFNSIWAEGPGAGTATGNGLKIDTSGVDGGNIFSKVLALNWGNDGIQVTGLNREFWMGQVVSDSNGGHGVNHFAGSNRAFFISNLWASGNSATGVRLSGTSSNPIQEGQIGQLYTIGNAAEGIILENTDGIQIGQAHSEDNDDGLRLANGTSDNFWCGNLRTKAITNFAIDGLDAGADTRIGTLVADSGTLQNITNFTSIGGVGQESANAETPTAANYSVGEIIDFTDSGDGSGTGYYIKDMNGNMDQIA